MAGKDLYSVLGLSRDADNDAVRKSFRKLAKELHPDRNPNNPAAEARFKEASHAFDVLGDPKKRKLYDEFGEDALRDGFDPDRHRRHRDWTKRQSRYPGREGSAAQVNVEDLFSGFTDSFDIFGAKSRRQKARGIDLESELTIDFADSIRGGVFNLVVERKNVQVRIPPGAEEGSRLRVAEHGGPGPSAGAPPGDLVLTIHVASHPHFRREEDDLHLNLPITVAEAYHGGKVRVPTVEGAVTLKVPPGTSSGTVMRVRGKGVSRKDKEAGDLYVHFMISVPKESAEVAKHIDAIAAKDTADPRTGIAL